MASHHFATTPHHRPIRNAVARLRMGSNELSVRAALAELKSELAQVERMIRVLEWASVRPKAAQT
jgi:hypothetical protein